MYLQYEIEPARRTDTENTAVIVRIHVQFAQELCTVRASDLDRSALSRVHEPLETVISVQPDRTAGTTLEAITRSVKVPRTVVYMSQPRTFRPYEQSSATHAGHTAMHANQIGF